MQHQMSKMKERSPACGAPADMRIKRRHQTGRSGIAAQILATWFFAALALALPLSASAQIRGNPLDALPKVDDLPSAPAEINIAPPAADPAMLKLLSSHLVPSRFQISGVTALPFDQVAAQFAALAKRDTTVAELLAAADKVTQMYRERGYPLSFAFIPAQSFDQNIVQVTVVEGYVKTVKVDGNPGHGTARLATIAGQLQKDRPLRQATFERVAGILSSQPGMQVVVNITPPTATDGGADMVLSVRRKPVTVGVGLDYRQRGMRGLITASANGLTPLGEQISVSTLQPSGAVNEKFYAVNYLQPISSDGLLAKFSASDYRSEPQNQILPSLQFESRYKTKATRVGAAISYPLMLDNTHNLTLTGAVYAAENDETYTRSVRVTPMQVSLRSQLRVFSGDLAWTAVTPGFNLLPQVRQAGFGLYKGLDALGASRENSRVDLDFNKATLHFSQSNQLSADVGVAFATSVQYSGNILPSSEKIGFGGRLFGLGYPAGDIAGDKGWGISAEINRQFPVSTAYLKSVQPYVIVDRARAYSNDVVLVHDTLGSVALGTRFSDGKYYTLDLSLAKPLADLPANASSRSLRFNLMYSYQLY